MLRKLFILSLFLISSIEVSAQFGFSHEVGVIAGPVAFQSDYGERYDFSTNVGNTGYGVGLVHYLNFAYRAECNCYTPDTYFNDHFKMRSELSFNETRFKHYGQWVAPEHKSLGADMLRAMRGSTSVTNLGIQLEYYPLSVRDFTSSEGAFGPFVSLGGQFSFYNPHAYSLMGNGELDNPETTILKYYNATSTEQNVVWSIVTSVGVRYKLAPLSDLMLDLRWQYYFSNWVDGLNPDPAVYKENRANDWLVWLNFGYIYYIQ